MGAREGGERAVSVNIPDLQADRAIKSAPEFFQVHDLIRAKKGRNPGRRQSSHRLSGILCILRPAEVDEPLVIFGRLARWRCGRLQLELTVKPRSVMTACSASRAMSVRS